MVSSNDHRTLGPRVGLFHFQEEAPGAVFWHPRGLRLMRLLEARIRRHIDAENYLEVRTPKIFSEGLWRRSGHWDNFRENLFEIPCEGHSFAVKPVSCPAHIELVKRMGVSHHALPLRLGEFGICHRKEPSGALHGLFRLFQFTQDDGHIFCAENHVAEEVARFAKGLATFYGEFGFDRISVGLSLRPPARAGSDEVWDRAERILEGAARDAGLDLHLQPGEGAFYGPKLEFTLNDRTNRAWTCGTIQLDFVLPERFELTYVGSDGAPHPMVLLHRALVGSLERFLGFLLEHHEGRLPPCLAPDQFVIAPVAESHQSSAHEALARFQLAGLRGYVDERAETLSRKVFDAQSLGIPWFVAIGNREAQEGKVSIRTSDGRSETRVLDEAIAWMQARAH